MHKYNFGLSRKSKSTSTFLILFPSQTDGVAPRAKLNQQRSRRYRSGGEGEIESTVYEAHLVANEEKERLRRLEEGFDDDNDDDNNYNKRRIRNDVPDSSYSFVLDIEEGNQIPSSDREYNSNSNSNGNNNSNSIDDKIIDYEKNAEKIDNNNSTSRHGNLQEVSRGRFKGKFEASSLSSSSSTMYASKSADTSNFHSNEITPGTPFFAEFTNYLEHFVKYKLSTDPKWKNLTIVFSGPNCPGEGEHKIMQFLREQREQPDYDPNLRHCIMGQDGDLIMLGLLTHEPNMVLLREKVIFNMTTVRLEKAHAAEAAAAMESSSSSVSASLDTYIHNPHFEFMHLQVLRDYLAYEFETSNVLSSAPWDLERTIDDFVFLTFLIGNDFLPHLPALDIADQAFDLLFYTYKNCRKEWQEQYQGSGGRAPAPYLTHAGNIVSGRRLESFFAAVGGHEVAYYDKKKQTIDAENRRLRKEYKRLNMKDTLPDDSIMASKEKADRAAYRDMLKSMEDSPIATNYLPLEENIDSDDNDDDDDDAIDEMRNNNGHGFMPVTTRRVAFQPVEEDLEEGLISKMGGLLRNSLSGSNDNASNGTEEEDERKYQLAEIDDQDLKGRYYYDKFEFTPFDADKHLALRKAYMEGLVWNLKYYYEGCVSWEYFYPYHYGPMLSDLVNLNEVLEEITFENKLGSPLNPFDQLMGCMPPSQAHHLPEPYRCLMADPDSPIIDFYPQSFVVDMNGKRWPWEAVTLLPFIDSRRLVEATSSIDTTQLTEEERERNATGTAVVIKHDPAHNEVVPSVGKSDIFHKIECCTAVMIPFEQTDLNYALDTTPVFKPEVKAGTKIPQPGFSTLRDAPIETLYRRRLGINVHGGKSRYKTASLEISGIMPPTPPVEMLAPKLIGTSVFVNYPYFVEALVTAVSDERVTVRGKKEPRKWTESESYRWRLQRDGSIRRFEIGEGYCGSGGLILPEDQPITLSVRPFQDFVTTRNGQIVKSFAMFELEIPLISTFWAPSQPDPRLRNIPSRLEKNVFEIAMNGNDVHFNKMSKLGKKGNTKRRKLFPKKPNSEKVSSLNGKQSRGINGGSRLATANYSTFKSRARRKKEDRRFFSGTNFSASDHLIANTSISAHLTKESSQGWLLTDNMISIASPSTRRYQYSAQKMIETPMITGTSTFLCSKSYKTRVVPKGIGYRGRLATVGFALATFCFNPVNANTRVNLFTRRLSFLKKQRDPYCIDSESYSLDCPIPPFLIRGGDFINSADHILPPTRLPPALEFAHGTTTLSFTFQGGIIAAVDSRASMGSFVGSKTTQKVLPVNSHMLGTMAGGAAG